MTIAASGGALWPLIAELGATIALPIADRPGYDALLAHLATLCEATTELWGREDGGGGTPSARWRLLAHGSPGAVVGPTPKAPAAVVSSAATALRPIAVAAPTPQVALPLIVQGQLQGVLYLHAEPERALLSWQDTLAGFAPFLALAVHASTLEDDTVETTRGASLSLANGTFLSEQLDREVARARRTCRPCAVLMIGIDRFPALADSVGPATCEQIAQALTLILRQICRDSDMVGRHDIDQQLIFLYDTDSQGAGLAAQRYLAQLYRRPIIVADHEPLYLDMSIGIAVFPVDGTTASELLENALTALKLAQHLGGRRAMIA